MHTGFAKATSDWRETIAFLRHYLSLPSALDWRLAIASFSLLLLGQAFMDRGRFGGGFGPWLGVSVVLQAVVVVVLLLGRRLVFSRPVTALTPLAVLVVYAIAQACRGLVAGLYVVATLPNGELEPVYRMVFTLPAALTTSVGLAVVFGARDEHRKLIADLEGKREANWELRATLVERLERAKADLIAEVRQQLAPSEKELESALEQVDTESDRRAAVSRIQRVLEREIRPLSRSIESPDSALPGSVVPPRVRDVWPQTLRGTALFFPRATAAWLIGLNFSQVARFDFRPLALLALAGQGLVIWALVRLGEGLVAKRSLPLVAGLGLAGLWTAFAAVLATQVHEAIPHAEIPNLAPANIAAGFIVGFALALFSAVSGQREQTERALADAVQSLRVSANLLEQRQWVAARRLRHVVHGALQGALVAAAIKLANAPEANEALVREIKADIAAALERLVHGGDDYTTFEAGLRSLREAWRGVCELDIAVSDDARQACDADSALGQCALEVVVEAVGNSIRHGRADRCEVTVRLVQELLQVKVRDNGEGPPVGAQPGIGSRFFDEACLDWKLERNGSRTLFQATFATAEPLLLLKDS